MLRPAIETWKAFQAEGKRNFVWRRVKWGAGVGVFVGAVTATALAVVGTKRTPLAIAIPKIMVASILLMSFGFLLWFLLLWELLRRRYSPS